MKRTSEISFTGFLLYHYEKIWMHFIKHLNVAKFLAI